jgi:hypothetical protein
MSDDASYNDFLSKANQDLHPGSGESTSQTRNKFDPTSTSSPPNDSLPASLKSIPQNLTYTSDTDSPFEPVFLNFASTELPSLSEFEKALGTKAEHGSVEELSIEDFDPRGEYKEVIEKVKQAGKSGGVKVFRLEISKTRCEYYVVTVGERKLVGVVAKAVES